MCAGDVLLPEDLDGFDQWDVLSDNQKVSRRSAILHNIDPKANASALRVGDMKLVFASRGGTRVLDSWYPTPSGSRRDEDGTVLEGPFVAYDESMEDGMAMQMLRVGSDVDGAAKNRVALGDEPDFYDGFRPSFLSDVASPQATVLTDILAKLGRKPPQQQQQGSDLQRPLVVGCGRRPANASTNCRPWIAACLYNVTEDPCEYHNLAPDRPDQVASLQKRLRWYKEKAVPPLNQPVDDAGLPYHHHWNWVPWRTAASSAIGDGRQ